MRHYAFYILGAFFCYFGVVGVASACTPNGEGSWSNCVDAGAAATVVASASWAAIANCNVRNERLVDNPVARTVTKFVQYGGDGKVAVCGYMYPLETGVGVAGYLAKCNSRPSSTTKFLPVTGSTQCWNGCVATYAQNVDETSVRSVTGGVCMDSEFKKNCPAGSYWNGYMGVCEPVQKSCPDNQELKDGVCHPKNQCPDGMVSVQGSTPGAVQEGSLYCKPAENECPAGNVKSPSGKCLPGDGQCAAGEAKRENGTCGKDKDGDGKADEDDDDPDNDPKKDSASGGDECDAPPSCSGNAIQCIQVKIQWRIDCNTRRQVNINGGTCEAVPICTGKGCNAMEYAQLMQQWRATCALEKLAKKDGDDKADGSDANGNGVPDALEGTGDVADAGDGTADVEGTKKFGIGVSTSLLSQENIFGGGSCPQPPTFKLMGQTISGSDFPYWCQAMAILRALILLWGAYTALKILMGWGF